MGCHGYLQNTRFKRAPLFFARPGCKLPSGVASKRQRGPMDRVRVEEIARALSEERGWGAPRFIDAGNSAAVFEVQVPNHGAAALKVYDPQFFAGDNAVIETKRVELQAQLKGHGNPHLIDMIETGSISGDGTWYILMEYCPWPSLSSRLGSVPNSKVPMLIKKLASAVIFLDQKGLVHRDIKPANIVVSEDFSDLKLLDLGVMRRASTDEGNGTDGDAKRRFIATAQYSPPEYLLREEADGEDGFKALNIYQVGAVLHDMIMKRPIFNEEASTENRYRLFRAVSNRRPYIENPDLPARIISLCKAAINKDPHQRIASVRLEDFCEEIDTVDTLRTRLMQSSAGAAALPMPSLLIWTPRVVRRLRSAARAEASALGPFRLRSVGSANAPRWILEFSNIGRSIEVQLTSNYEARCLEVRLISGYPRQIEVIVFEIFDDSSDEKELVSTQFISEQILYMVDIAGEPVDESIEAIS